MTTDHHPPQPLWDIPLEVVGVTGEYQAGKTLWVLSIASDPTKTLYFDFEKSGASYARQLGVTRVDFPRLAQQKFPNGYRPIDLFVFWKDHVLTLQPGQWQVIAVDPINDLQDGLVAWVKENASHFGRTASQYLKMSQLLWGDAKSYLKQLLNEIATRCETFAFTTHMRDVYRGALATGKREAKGLDTFYEMASVYLQLERKPDAQRHIPREPSAIVLKDRLAKLVTDEQAGSRKWINVLPKRMPVCTPASLRDYMKHPVGLRDTQPDELMPDRKMTDDERLQLQAEISQAQRDAEAFKLEQQSRQFEAERLQKTSSTTAPPPHRSYAPEIANRRLTDAQVQSIRDLKAEMEQAGLTREKYREWLKPYGVESALHLTIAQAEQFIQFLREHSCVCDLVDPTTTPEKGGDEEADEVDATMASKS